MRFAAGVAVAVLAACAHQSTVAPVPVTPSPVTVSCPTSAPTTAAFAPERILGARVETVCLVGAGDETSLRLREAVAPREGTVLDAASVRLDLTELFDTGLIAHASAYAERTASGSVVLTYVVVERPIVSAVRLEGGPSLPNELRQQLDGKGFRDTLGQRGQRLELVRSFYEEHGFSEATVDAHAVGTELVITISEGPRFVVEAVRFEGVQALTTKELEQLVATKVGAPVRPEFLERDALNLLTTYYDRGHVLAKVDHQRQRREGAPGATTIVFTVDEGPAFRVGAISLMGVALGPAALKTLESRQGAVFSRSMVQRDLERLRAAGEQQGKVFEVFPLTEIDRARRTVKLIFEVNEAH